MTIKGNKVFFTAKELDQAGLLSDYRKSLLAMGIEAAGYQLIIAEPSSE